LAFRNSPSFYGLSPEQRRQKCVRKPALVPDTALYQHVHDRLVYDCWSPEQISSHLHANGLLRQFLPKGADLSEVSQLQLNRIAKLLNGRPRKTLNWKTPEEAMTEEIKKFSDCCT